MARAVVNEPAPSPPAVPVPGSRFRDAPPELPGPKGIAASSRGTRRGGASLPAVDRPPRGGGPGGPDEHASGGVGRGGWTRDRGLRVLGRRPGRVDGPRTPTRQTAVDRGVRRAGEQELGRGPR